MIQPASSLIPSIVNQLDVALKSQLPVIAMSSSTLVETVSLNYEDFSESFLTCSTCLCPYDNTEHRAKLLSCSHTVCAQCLERIIALPQCRDTGIFRCPICRESVTVPRGGVPGLPPSFLVNQLIDLMQRQRKDVVPKCGAHPAEELLFCETCDTVFCPLCSDPTDVNNLCHNHTIVPFSIAIKRMSEILLYKANQCVKNLNKATENVQREMNELDRNVDKILDQVNSSFQDLSVMLDKRRREIIDAVRDTRDDKRRVLQEQMGIIQTEKAKVEQECNGLHHQVEVRHITRKISDLNEKLDSTLTLVEPRENAFLRYDSSTGQVSLSMAKCLSEFGSVCVSQTFPPLCTATPLPGCTYTRSTVILNTIDYNGQMRKCGGDPVQAMLHLIQYDDSLLCQDGLSPRSLSVSVQDHNDGTYSLNYRAPKAGSYKMDIKIFGRPIKNSPVQLQVSAHHNPIWQFGSLGCETHSLKQPVRVACTSEGQLFILDTGNNRVTVLNSEGEFVRHMKGEGLKHASATGLALLCDPLKRGSPLCSPCLGLLTLNWRTKTVSEWSLSDSREVKTFTFSEFEEPIDLAVDSGGRILVADNGAKKVFVFDCRARPLFSFPIKCSLSDTGPRGRGSKGTCQPSITCLTIGLNDDILVGGSDVQLFDADGKYVRRINVSETGQSQLIMDALTPSKLEVGGLSVDPESGTVLASVHENKSSHICVSSYKGDFNFVIDSESARLRRPSGLCIAQDYRHCLLADLANHSVKKYCFK